MVGRAKACQKVSNDAIAGTADMEDFDRFRLGDAGSRHAGRKSPTFEDGQG